MGKKKGKAGRLPKKIAGVKLPKEARKQAEKAIAELQQPIVREVIAGAIGMAAAALAKQAASAVAARPVAEKAPKSGADEPANRNGGEQLAEIATGLAMAGLGRLFEKVSATVEAGKKPA